jgi:hypothetical protein
MPTREPCHLNMCEKDVRYVSHRHGMCNSLGVVSSSSRCPHNSVSLCCIGVEWCTHVAQWVFSHLSGVWDMLELCVDVLKEVRAGTATHHCHGWCCRLEVTSRQPSVISLTRDDHCHHCQSPGGRKKDYRYGLLDVVSCCVRFDLTYAPSCG